ncbi:subtilisin-like protease [Senna tora]|uniref:Subtilisin-like protease n=1 Tax=Senna tora TaxID=362788 RepID=A0A834WC34_9FABA|nr:subtilisin-like protease [Senna tora]
MGFSIFQLLPPLLIFLSTFFYQQTQAIKKPYIVYLGSHSHGLNPSSLDMDSATDSHYDLLSSVLGSHEKAKEAIFYSYNKHINGFAALLEEEEAEEIKKNKNVVSVFVSKMHKLHTTRSWAFLQQERNRRVNRNSAWKRGRFGQNTIIANIDTGVWPESKSFSDKGYGGIPSKWRGGGICQINNLPTSNKTLCNNKLIGARIFNDGYKALYGAIDPAHHNSARDIIGHGTHTLSTAAGNFVRGANVLGNGNGTAKGGSPRARVASYKACWDPSDEGGCVEADLLAAFDQAISDGVDVLSVSVGAHKEFPESLLTDGISIGAFHAVAKGVVVVCSAGNQGPKFGTVKNVAPWSFTIGASSIDREFSNNLTMSDGTIYKGISLTTGLPDSLPLIRASDAKLPNATTQDA